MPPEKKSAGYSAADIQNLSARDQVRLRPSTYIGGTGTSSLVHLVDEVLANSADEALAGHATSAAVTIHKDLRVTIEDNARGIPIGETKLADGRTVPTVQAALTEMFTGGKYAIDADGSEAAYSGGSGGMNGMGLKAVTFTSSEVTVDVRRDGKRYVQTYRNGAKGSAKDLFTIEPPVITAYKEKDTGTRITFRYDESIFDADAELDGTRIKRKCYNLSRLVPGFAITFADERSRERETFVSKKGIADFVTEMNDGESPLFRDIVTVDVVRQVTDANGAPIKIRIEAAFQPAASETTDDRGLAFTNLVHNPDQGTHVDGFRKGLTRALNDHFKKQNLFKKDADGGFSSVDVVSSGLSYVVSLRAPANAVQYESQTKKCLTSAWADPAIANIVAESVRDWLGDHPEQAKSWFKYLDEVRKTREAMMAERKAVKAKIGGGVGLDPLISKLARETTRNPARAEIYFVEGDSAGGNAKKARDRAFQAILPFRGKMLNTMKELSRVSQTQRMASRTKVLSNEDVRRIATALETGMGANFDLSKLRYDKVILMADADADGGHIVFLWIGVFWSMYPEILKRGHLYIAIPPLFSVYDLKAKKRLYFYDAREMAAWTKGRSKDSYTTTRFKGLGEMQAEDLERTAMNPATRRLRQITVEDVAETKAILDTLMGDRDASGRRAFMDEHCRGRSTREDVTEVS